jgi:hypothetical protein
MIERWIFYGEIDDAQYEFFVQMNRKETAEGLFSDNFSDDRFSIIEAFVPKFIPPAVIDRIFSAGKAQSILIGFTREKMLAHQSGRSTWRGIRCTSSSRHT